MVSLQSVSRRQHHRFERPEMGVRLNGLSGSTRDWSLGGIAVRLPDDGLPDDGLPDDGLSGLGEAEEVSGELEIGPSGERHDFKGRIVRVERDQDLVAIKFSRLSEGAVMTFVNYFRLMMAGAY